MKGLTDNEKKLKKHLAKLLPDAVVYLSYARSVTWLTVSLGIKPKIVNLFRLNISVFHDGKITERFEWEGKKLPDGIKKLHEWNQNRSRLKLAPIGLPAPKPELPLLDPAPAEEES